jgi:hypothetical protein
LRLRTRAGSIAAASGPAATAATAASPPLLVGSGRPGGFSASGFARSLRARRDRNEAGQAAWAAPPAGLLAGARVHLLDALVEFSQPLFHRPLDLRAWRAWLLRPDARPLGANGFWR